MKTAAHAALPLRCRALLALTAAAERRISVVTDGENTDGPVQARRAIAKAPGAQGVALLHRLRVDAERRAGSAPEDAAAGKERRRSAAPRRV